jgi:hypothetical protein
MVERDDFSARPNTALPVDGPTGRPYHLVASDEIKTTLTVVVGRLCTKLDDIFGNEPDRGSARCACIVVHAVAVRAICVSIIVFVAWRRAVFGGLWFAFAFLAFTFLAFTFLAFTFLAFTFLAFTFLAFTFLAFTFLAFTLTCDHRIVVWTTNHQQQHTQHQAIHAESMGIRHVFDNLNPLPRPVRYRAHITENRY